MRTSGCLILILLLASSAKRTIGWTSTSLLNKGTTKIIFSSTEKYRRPASSSGAVIAKMSAESAEGVSSSSCTKPSSAQPRRKLYTFVEARRIARGHGFQSVQEFIDYDCAGAYQLPKDADVVWADQWRGWDDFLGIVLSFEEGRKVARGLEGVNDKDDYLEFMKTKKMPDDHLSRRLPYRPDLFYKEDWSGWDDFLGC